ncbi:hypothetical protein HPB48_017004 [Haemaphysalis longicornis]|uniref:Uncharacterized protein n=1 Tax=Haemaphysalis longicornis TaxID=44386 RepID=A0A9J6G7X6_HAELO|nr:hypothetical protein HPB48_017004 [Haemaphysalis longicornis]
MLPAVKPVISRGVFSSRIKRCLTTWSRLASRFNSIGKRKNNFQFGFGERSGLFGHAVLQEPSGFYLLKEQAIDDAEKYVREATDPKRSRKMVQVFDDLSDALCRVADMVSFPIVGGSDVEPCNWPTKTLATKTNPLVPLNCKHRFYNAFPSITMFVKKEQC